MNRTLVETLMGTVVLVIAVIFLGFAYSSTEVATVGGYTLSARFDHVEGTRAGGDVRLSGIKVGTITSQTLDPKTFQAVLQMNIDSAVKLPVDTVATITSAGLLGDKFLQLVPGADDQTIAPGGTIKFTQSPVSLESLLGQFVFSMQGNGKPAEGSAAPAPSAPSPAPSPSGSR